MNIAFKKYFCFLIALVLLCEFCFSSEDSTSALDEQIDTLNYGLQSDVVSLIETLTKNKDATISDAVYEKFTSTKNPAIRESIINYFSAIKDARLKDFCLDFLQDPYDEKKSTVSCVLNYVSALEIKEASPYILDILKSENDELFTPSLTACGKLGGKDEAEFLIQYLKDNTLSVQREQAVMKTLSELCVAETFDDLIEIAKDEDKNAYVRRYAIEAVSKMGKSDVIPVLQEVSSSAEPILRCSAVRGSANFITDENCEAIIMDGLTDNHQNVRYEAVCVCKEQKFKKALSALIFRAKKDAEANIKYEAYKAIAAINEPRSSEFLSSVILDTNLNETSRAKAVDAVLEYSVLNCYADVKKLALETLSNDKEKNLRYAIGKSIAKYTISDYEDVCKRFLETKDAATQGIGLDIFAKNKYVNLLPLVKAIAENSDKKTNANVQKAKLILEKSNL